MSLLYSTRPNSLLECANNLKYAPCGDHRWVCSITGYDSIDKACENPSIVTECGMDSAPLCPGHSGEAGGFEDESDTVNVETTTTTTTTDTTIYKRTGLIAIIMMLITGFFLLLSVANSIGLFVLWLKTIYKASPFLHKIYAFFAFPLYMLFHK